MASFSKWCEMDFATIHSTSILSASGEIPSPPLPPPPLRFLPLPPLPPPPSASRRPAGRFDPVPGLRLGGLGLLGRAARAGGGAAELRRPGRQRLVQRPSPAEVGAISGDHFQPVFTSSFLVVTCIFNFICFVVFILFLFSSCFSPDVFFAFPIWAMSVGGSRGLIGSAEKALKQQGQVLAILEQEVHV